MLQRGPRSPHSSESGPTNADTVSREEKRSRHRLPSDPLDLHPARSG
ncbi:hypothetical protein CORC01_00081 [Colletotrichum orchidophilum]|uniref:Uncharacterized protein n=1 Tax=Colletotrichum orchidophilum TaxID=1209926 RepID=A0A1G4BT76_9PEZI|nr:uncharacterized protein CORC01_00081 [Colletotrichum orchidophilum]OHF04610.1 hypothetical protein CORC01_00081 [Colletotrichum orchidophilum]